VYGIETSKWYTGQPMSKMAKPTSIWMSAIVVEERRGACVQRGEKPVSVI
jgi:hypothetical protein